MLSLVMIVFHSLKLLDHDSKIERSKNLQLRNKLIIKMINNRN